MPSPVVFGEPTVECYSGHTYAQEPRAIVAADGLCNPVAEIEHRWRTPEGPAFRVRAKTGERLELHYLESEDRWTVTVLAQSEPAVPPCG